MAELDDVIVNRRSVKEFDPDYKIPHEEMDEMMEKVVEAPSSINMQPWRFAVVESDEAKEKIRPYVRFNTTQNDTSSAMIIVFGDLECYKEGEYIYNEAVNHGHMPAEVRDQTLPFAVESYKQLTREEMDSIIRVDCGLAAMQLMLVAKEYGYDTNPIGGFEEDQIGEAIGYSYDRYEPMLIVAIGKKAKEPHTSFRMPVDKVVNYL